MKARKKIPTFKDEDEEREFWSREDSTEYLDWSKARHVTLPNLRPSMSAENLHPGCINRVEIPMIDYAKFKEIREEILAEKGDLTLFALFLRENSAWWDVLVAASWLSRDDASGLKYMTRKLTAKLSKRELLELSKVVVVEQSDPDLRKLLREIVVAEGEVREIENTQFAGLSLARAIIFQAKTPELAGARAKSSR